METVITLLIVLIPVAFKLIGKALEKASDTPGIPQRRTLHAPVDDSAVKTTSDSRGGIMPAEAVLSKPENIEDNEGEESKENKEKKGNKIDPKKLILYSEIMKPKY